MRRNALVAGTVAVIIVGLLVAALFYVQRDSGGFLLGGSDPEPPAVVMDQWHNGTVQGGSAGMGLPPTLFGDRSGSFRPPAEARSCRLTLDWDPSGPGGADTLHLQVERGPSGTTEASGPPGLELNLPGPVANLDFGFTVSPDGVGSFVSQAFSLHVVCVGA